jgi:hypothetical protein
MTYVLTLFLIYSQVLNPMQSMAYSFRQWSMVGVLDSGLDRAIVYHYTRTPCLNLCSATQYYEVSAY